MSAKLENDPDFSDAALKPTSVRTSRLVKVLLGLVLIVPLAALFSAIRTAALRVHRYDCVNNLKQIGLALHNYEQAYKVLPPAYTVDADGRPLHSWRTLILPYLEQEKLYQTIDLSKPWNDPTNARALKTPLGVFRCQAAVGPRNTTTYLAIVAPNCCLMATHPRRLADITDAHELTLMVIEAGVQNAVPWMAPVDADDSLVMSLGPTTKLHHERGTNGCFVDGSVRFLKADTTAAVRRALMSNSGNDNEVAKEIDKQW
jgi:prepilin-type processing-associated H-X9-DG protein